MRRCRTPKRSEGFGAWFSRCECEAPFSQAEAVHGLAGVVSIAQAHARRREFQNLTPLRPMPTAKEGVQLVDRAGHWPMEEQPEIVSQQLIGFLKST